MNRDNGLFALGGVLIGFVMAYMAFETMSVRQPALRAPGDGPAQAQAAGQTPGQPGVPPGGAAGGDGADAQRGFEQVQQLRRYVEENPDDADAVLTLANLNFEIRNFGRARELYERYLALRPGNADVMTDLGVSFRNLGEPQKALEQFRLARESQPDHWISLFNEVVVHAFDLRDYAAAEVGVEELRALQPGNSDVERLASEIERRRADAS